MMTSTPTRSSKPIAQKNLAVQAYEILEEMIVTLQLLPGEVITERELSERIGIGRTPMRDAIKRLESQQLVRAIPRHGILTADLTIANQFLILETRRGLDRLIARRATLRATPEQRLRLATLAEEIVVHAHTQALHDYLHIDYKFDELLCTCAQNPFATEATQPLHIHSRRFWYAHRLQSEWTTIAELHASVMHAVIDGDENVATAVSDALIDHLYDFTRAVMESV